MESSSALRGERFSKEGGEGGRTQLYVCSSFAIIAGAKTHRAVIPYSLGGGLGRDVVHGAHRARTADSDQVTGHAHIARTD